MNEISDKEMISTIAEFLELGHVENIIALFKQEPEHYRFTGELIRDERFMVRMGMAVLFEDLAQSGKMEILRAIPYLKPVLQEKTAYMRADAATLLGIIGTAEATEPLKKLLNDPDEQVAEIARDILAAKDGT